MNDELREIIQSFICGMATALFLELLTYILLDILGIIK